MKIRKNAAGLAALLLSLALLAGCGPAASPESEVTPPVSSPDPSECVDTPEPSPDAPQTVTCRIADGAEDGTLLLAKADGEAWDVYTLDATAGIVVSVGGGSADWSELRDGMTVNVQYNGVILETYPAQLAGASAISAAGDEVDDRCGLYLQVLEDLWNVGAGLNSDVSTVVLDLSGLTHLTDSEKAAVAWRFGQLRGLPVVEGTLEELAQEGYLSQVGSGKAPDGVEHPLYQWDDGGLFTIATDTEAVWNLPAEPISLPTAWPGRGRTAHGPTPWAASSSPENRISGPDSRLSPFPGQAAVLLWMDQFARAAPS